MSWISRLANAFRSSQTNTDLEEELQFHLDQRISDLVRSGMSREEAELVARRQLGNTVQLRESMHEVTSAAWLEALLRDFRYGLRMFAKHRSTSLAAVASLAVAAGACTVAFALIDALILRPLPVEAPDEIVDIARVMPDFMRPGNQPFESDSDFSYSQYELLHDTARNSADLFAMRLSPGLRPAAFDDAAGGETENIRAELISGRGFEILRVKPELGRLVQQHDDSLGADPVAVLSDGFWKRRFGGSPSVLGRTVTIGLKRFQIVGVAAEPFSGVQPGYRTDVWLPLSAAADARDLADPDSGGINVWGRLHPGVERSQLREPLQAVLTNFLRERFRINPPRNLSGVQLQQFAEAPLLVRDASGGRDSLFRYQFGRPLWIVALISALLLLLACSNVANLMLARASARAAELALRVSLGATRFRLLQQMLMESGQLAALSFVLSLLFTAWVAPVIVARLGSTEFPAWLDVALDSRTIAFASGLSLLTVLMFGLLPALRASSASPNTALKAGAVPHPVRIRSLQWMLTAQIGFSVAVLFLSGLLLTSFRRLITLNLGFAQNNVILFDLFPRDRQNHRADSGAELLEHLRGLPDVQSASISQPKPMGGDTVWIMAPVIRMPGRENETVRPREVSVSAGFFDAMQIRWITGRDFLPEERTADSLSVIVNQAFIEKFLPGVNPIGQTFDKFMDAPSPLRQKIVGVVANFRFNNPREAEQPSIYTPLRDVAGATLNVRTGSDTATAIAGLKKEIERTAPALRVSGSLSLESQIDNTLLSDRLLALLAGFFSLATFLLAAVGLYGVVKYGAVRRTREIGIRIALGARRSSVVRLIVTDTLAPVIAGALAGIAGGVGMARYLVSQLFGVTPTDFWSLASPLSCLLIASIAAVLPPTLRAAGADPLITLRHE